MPEIEVPALQKKCMRAYVKCRNAGEDAVEKKTVFERYTGRGLVDEDAIRKAFPVAMAKAKGDDGLEDVAQEYAEILAAWFAWNKAEDELKLATVAMQDALTELARGVAR